MYLAFPSSAGEPPKVLRGFSKVYLQPGEQSVQTLTVSARDCSIWNTDQHAWELVSGSFGVLIGASSADIRLQATLNVDSSEQ